MIPLTGDIVRVRSRQYLVEGVVPPPGPRDSTLVRLSCLEDDAQCSWPAQPEPESPSTR